MSHSYNSDNINYYWDFGSEASPQYSALNDPTVIYQEKGSHDVNLIVCNGAIDSNPSYCNETTRENYIYILDDVDVTSEGIKQDFSQLKMDLFQKMMDGILFHKKTKKHGKLQLLQHGTMKHQFVLEVDILAMN